ncbi:MAG TPA: DUF885 domain-containing protein [Xanthomonadales bacterium]|nr:DUF885 domain-containing protein [Xanthomonadales bacterium]
MRRVIALISLVCFAATTPLQAGFVLEEWQQRVTAENNIDQLGRLYIEFTLEEDPSQSSSLGIHGKGEEPSYYDRMLPDASALRLAANEAGRLFLLQKLQGIDAASLSRAEQIDLHILAQRVKLDQFQVQRLGALVNPLNWATTLGEAMSGLVLRDYAPLDQRLQSFGARCAATGPFLDQVQQLLLPATVRPTELEKVVTLQRLTGMTGEGALYAKTLPGLMASSGLDAEQQSALSASCAAAVSRIKAFADWFDEVVVPREDGAWRLGWQLYDEKYTLQMDYPLDSESLLAVADAWLTLKGNELVSVGREIHDVYLAAEIEQETVKQAADSDDQQVVRDIFTKLSNDRSTTESLIADSYAMADSIVSFVREQNLMDLPPASKLRIEPTPPHLAGNAVAQIQTAPPFEPQLESVWFWDLELLAGAEDYLKEYNRPTLAMVYIHEGVPGHFVQLEYSNRSERVIPRVFWNGPMVEGWASYIATQLVEVGFTVYPDQPWGHQLQQMVDDKLVLRSVINAIIDIRLHRTNWPEEEAVKLMMSKGFQEEGEARGKLLRAKLGSVQLTSYFAGQLAIENLLDDYRKLRGDEFSWKEFNERLVGAGSPPFFAIREYMLGK